MDHGESLVGSVWPEVGNDVSTSSVAATAAPARLCVRERLGNGLVFVGGEERSVGKHGLRASLVYYLCWLKKKRWRKNCFQQIR